MTLDKPVKSVKAKKPIGRKKRPRRQRKTSQAVLRREADKLCGQIVRARGKCEAAGYDEYRCKGPLQWAHGFSRRYAGVRWNRMQTFCLCSGHHMKYGADPIGWDTFMRSQLGDSYDEIRRLALRVSTDLDLPAIVAELRDEWKTLCGSA